MAASITPTKHGLQINDIVALTTGIGDRASNHPIRIKSFLKHYVPPPITPEEQEILDLLDELNVDQNVHVKSLALPEIVLIRCLPSEAHYVSGTGICGGIFAIEKITKSGTANFSDERLAQDIERYQKGDFANANPLFITDYDAIREKVISATEVHVESL
jgi:hypothetical protein